MSILNFMLLSAVVKSNAAGVYDSIKMGADVNMITPFGEPVLILTLQLGSLQIVKLLLDNGADKTVFGRDGKNAVKYAVEQNLHDALELLGKYGAPNEVVIEDVSGKSTDPVADLLFSMEEFLFSDSAYANVGDFNDSISGMVARQMLGGKFENLLNDYNRLKSSAAPLSAEAEKNKTVVNNSQKIISKNIKSDVVNPVKNDAVKSVSDSQKFNNKTIKLDAVKPVSSDEGKVVDLKTSIDLQKTAVELIEKDILKFKNLSAVAGSDKYNKKIKNLNDSLISKTKNLTDMENDLLNMENNLKKNHESNPLNPQGEGESKDVFDFDGLVAHLKVDGPLQSIQAEGLNNSNHSPTSTEEDYSVQPADAIALNLTQDPLM